MIKIRILSILVAAFSSLLIASSATAQKGGGGGGSVELSPTSIVDFGDVDIDALAPTASFRITNNTAGAVEIELPGQAGEFTIVSGSGSYSLPASNYVDVVVAYDPKQTGVDYLELSVGPELDLSIGLIGRGTYGGDCGFLVAETDFGTVEIGTPVTVAVLVGNNNVMSQQFTYAGGCDAFTLLSASTITVPVGQTGQFSVEFDPNATGEYFARLTTNCGSSTLINGKAVNAAPKAGPGEFSPASTGVSMRVGPNPMQGDAAIRFANAGRDPISAELRIVDLRGRVLFSQPMEIPSGGHQWRWDGRDRDGQSVAAGVYFIELVAPGTTVRQKVTVLR